MLKEALIQITTLISFSLTPLTGGVLRDVPQTFLSPLAEIRQEVLAEETLDLTNRVKAQTVNRIFTDNILLSLRHLNQAEKNQKVDWEAIRQPYQVAFVLEPGQVFSFHATTLPEFKDPTVTMNTEFSRQEGYQTYAGLSGNGVCHLATLVNLAAEKAGLEVVAPVRHDFYLIPDFPRENGTSIRTFDQRQNLYIKNTLDQPVIFVFNADQAKVDLRILAPINLR